MKKAREWGLKIFIVISLASFAYLAVRYDFWQATLSIIGIIFLCIMIPLARMVIKKMTHDDTINQY